MAIARLTDGTELDDGATVYTVETWPQNDGPFTGPDDRAWANFVVTDDGAEFQWRTPADRIRAIAQRVAAGALAIEDAMADYETDQWLSRAAGSFIDGFKDEVPGLADLPDAEFAKEMFVRVGQHLTNAGPFGWYVEDDDACASDAAYALDLPAWAETETFEGGAPGSGYTGECIVLAPGKTLDNLAEWLKAREAGTKEPA